MRLDEGDHWALVLWATDCAEHVLLSSRRSTRKTTDLGMPSKRSAGVVLCYPSDLEDCILLAV